MAATATLWIIFIFFVSGDSFTFLRGGVDIFSYSIFEIEENKMPRLKLK
jgi:hypothetical protein